MTAANYNEDSIRSLDWKEHIRLRPGMYIGKMGNGSSPDDGVYVLLKEVIDNSIDEFVMGNGKTIEVSVKKNKVIVRDFGRGIPLGKVADCVSKINTGAKYDSKVFKKSVGLNGIGLKAANALSSHFRIRSIREGKSKLVEFNQGDITNDEAIQGNTSRKGTKVTFIPDEKLFGKYRFL
ncbi:ATP-binding protein, partial [Flavobacteriales bacterium]|nr:ATP-binding protein [Flavobacteriales bacterium]